LIRDGRIVQFIHESVRDFSLHRDGLGLIYPGLGQSVVGKKPRPIGKSLHQCQKGNIVATSQWMQLM
jgi:hypothetical protein